MEQLHQDFLEVDEAHRWTGSLPDLYERLRSEALHVPEGSETPFAWRVLPRGARVGIRTADKIWPRRELVISRKKKPEDPTRWEQEVAVFLEQFGVSHWQPAPITVKTGVAARYLELYPGEVSIGFTKCLDCPTLIPYEPAFAKTNRCTPCAIEAGKREQVARSATGPLFDGAA